MTADKDLQALKKVAEAATPGPWEDWEHCAGEPYIQAGDDAILTFCWMSLENEIITYENAEKNADFVAAFDPPTALSLIEELTEAREALYRIGWLVRGGNAIHDTAKLIELFAEHMPPESVPSGEGGMIEHAPERAKWLREAEEIARTALKDNQ